jgi:hypothetical protein
MEFFMGVCTGPLSPEEVAISLIQSGKIKISSDGHIIDLGEAIRLSRSKTAKDKAASLKLRLVDQTKRRRIGESADQ